MRLDHDECWRRLRQADHGVLGTVHAQRGIDLVPVVFAVIEQRIAIPVDTVKDKRTTRLQRLANLAADPRCTLMVEHYDEDWSLLWWVRVHGQAVEHDADDPLTAGLARRYPQYRTSGAIASIIVVTPEQVSGWAALDST